MVDPFTTPLLTPEETARHLQLPVTTLRGWTKEKAAGAPLVHTIAGRTRGHPNVPFVAVIEAYVLRSLRELRLSTHKIRAAAEEVRRSFATPYGLATRRIATDGIDVFMDYIEADELARVGDGQRPIRATIENYLKYIVWDEAEEFPSRLKLRQYPDIAPVIIDPRFGWGAPVLERTKVPVDAVVGLWRAGEPIALIADEYELTTDEVDAITRAA
ncbi:DUF433 domain-containing protein [Dactylosporangium sp. CS-033363]|uniref:DUF433 domain-containing protein n=1 Tax=Dactylosporangium sp. CS-033363 TaxID=3239935 RepID=UPI003D94E499